MNLSIGRIVHVRIPDFNDTERWRAALVVSTFGPKCGNVRVFLDPMNDRDLSVEPSGQLPGLPFHATTASLPDGSMTELHGSSLTEGDGVGNWRWPPRESA